MCYICIVVSYSYTLDDTFCEMNVYRIKVQCRKHKNVCWCISTKKIIKEKDALMKISSTVCVCVCVPTNSHCTSHHRLLSCFTSNTQLWSFTFFSVMCLSIMIIKNNKTTTTENDCVLAKFFNQTILKPFLKEKVITLIFLCLYVNLFKIT